MVFALQAGAAGADNAANAAAAVLPFISPHFLGCCYMSLCDCYLALPVLPVVVVLVCFVVSTFHKKNNRPPGGHS